MKQILKEIKEQIDYKKILMEEVGQDFLKIEFLVDRFYKQKEVVISKGNISNFSGYENEEGKVQKIQVKMNSKKSFKSHQELGEELDLFFFNEAAVAMPFFKNKGRIVYELLQKIAKDSYHRGGYSEIISPQIYNSKLWEISGHMSHFKENMYFIENESMAVKPMNCPGHILFYKNKKRHINELPLRIGELGRVHRKEDSGSVHGLFRVRSFIQDDAHIFCDKKHIFSEISEILKEAISLYNLLGFNDIKINFSSRPEKAVGSDELWNDAEDILKDVLSKYEYNHKEGDGAFYGPKIDLHLKDSLGREYQVGSIQLDFNLGERFSCEYWDSEGAKSVPIIIHRALFGSLERFLGLLLEHHQGWLPDVISPVEYAILPVSDKNLEYAKEISLKLDRCLVLENESLSKRKKICIKNKIPKLIVVGDREMESKSFKIENLREKIHKRI